MVIHPADCSHQWLTDHPAVDPYDYEPATCMWCGMSDEDLEADGYLLEPKQSELDALYAPRATV